MADNIHRIFNDMHGTIGVLMLILMCLFRMCPSQQQNPPTLKPEVVRDTPTGKIDEPLAKPIILKAYFNGYDLGKYHCLEIPANIKKFKNFKDEINETLEKNKNKKILITIYGCVDNVPAKQNAKYNGDLGEFTIFYNDENDFPSKKSFKKGSEITNISVALLRAYDIKCLLEDSLQSNINNFEIFVRIFPYQGAEYRGAAVEVRIDNNFVSTDNYNL